MIANYRERKETERERERERERIMDVVRTWIRGIVSLSLSGRMMFHRGL